MFTWKSLARIVSKFPSPTVVIARQARKNSYFPLAFRKCRLLTHGIARRNDYPNQYCLYIEPTSANNCGHAVRFRSDRASHEKKDSSVLQDLVETREQPQTQLTVGAKGLFQLICSLVAGIIQLNFISTNCYMFKFVQLCFSCSSWERCHVLRNYTYWIWNNGLVTYFKENIILVELTVH